MCGKKLKDPAAAIKDCLADYNIAVSEREAELLALQEQFARRNPSFETEYQKVVKIRESGDPKAYEEARRAFRQRWNLQNFDEIIFKRQKSVKVKDADFPALIIEVDITNSRKIIMEDFEVVIKKWKDDADERLDTLREMESNDATDVGFHEVEPTLLDKILKGERRYISTDFQDYIDMLEVWDLKEREKLSWSQITTQLDISINTARYRYKRAKELIKTGLPGFLHFPE